jgi:hypothetical protein
MRKIILGLTAAAAIAISTAAHAAPVSKQNSTVAVEVNSEVPIDLP